MFKIVENGDGTTSIFCNESGQLVCTVRGRKSSVVGISRPFPKAESTVISHRTVYNYKNSDSKQLLNENQYISNKRHKSHSDDEDDDKVSCSSFDVEDPADDCVDNISFLQSLNLIQAGELQNRQLSELKSTFPSRKISRIKYYSEQHCINLLENVKLFDETELCSPLGQCALKSQKYLTEREISSLVKKYEKYCQISVLSVHPNSINLPQLRCRDNLKYPVTYRPNNKLKISWCHKYSFGYMQRNSRYKALKTGLSARSHKLKKLCKKFQVLVHRLTKDDLENSLYKSNINHSELNDRICFNEEEVKEDSNTISVCSSVREQQRENYNNKFNTNKSNSNNCNSSYYRKLFVELENILENLVWIGNKIYVKDTDIYISDQDISILPIDKPRNILRMKRMSCIKNNSTITEWVPLYNRCNIIKQTPITKNLINRTQNSTPQLISKTQNKIHLISQKNSNSLKPKSVHTCSKFCCKHGRNSLIQDHDYSSSSDETSVLFRSKKKYSPRNICITLETTNDINSEQTNSLLLNGNNQESYEKLNGNARKNVYSSEFPNTNNVEIIPLLYQSSKHYLNNNKSNVSSSTQNLDNIANIASTEIRKENNRSELSVSPNWINYPLNIKKNTSKVLPSQHTFHYDYFGNSSNENDLNEILPDVLVLDSCQKSKTVSSYMFKCHGCGYKATFEKNWRLLQSANDHMTMYHSVIDPSSFLKNNCIEYDDHLEIVIEAFPGYKSTDFPS